MDSESGNVCRNEEEQEEEKEVGGKTKLIFRNGLVGDLVRDAKLVIAMSI